MEYGNYNTRSIGQQQQDQPNYDQPNYDQPMYNQGNNYQPQPAMGDQGSMGMGGVGGGMLNREDSLQGPYGGPPPKGGIRPRVDPEATGEVDPEKYPQPKESTHKIRGRTDVLELLCGGTVDPELLTAKTFYFFFYSAFGSLFPLMAVYFKQMGMNPGQCGLLIGSRPFVEFLSAPFWGSLADRTQKGKLLLLASLSCWILFTVPLGFIQPPATSCILRHNHTEYVLRTPGTEEGGGGAIKYLYKRSAIEDGDDGIEVLEATAAEGGGGGVGEDEEEEVEVVMEAREEEEGLLPATGRGNDGRGLLGSGGSLIIPPDGEERNGEHGLAMMLPFEMRNDVSKEEGREGASRGGGAGGNKMESQPMVKDGGPFPPNLQGSRHQHNPEGIVRLKGEEEGDRRTMEEEREIDALQNEASQQEIPGIISSPVAPGGPRTILRIGGGQHVTHTTTSSGGERNSPSDPSRPLHDQPVPPSGSIPRDDDEVTAAISSAPMAREGSSDGEAAVARIDPTATVTGGGKIEIGSHASEENQENKWKLGKGKDVVMLPSIAVGKAGETPEQQQRPPPSSTEPRGSPDGVIPSSSAPSSESSPIRRVRRSVRPKTNPGESPIPVAYASNYDPGMHSDWLSPIFSPIVYRAADIQKAFFLLLLLVIVGEFFSAPAVPLADAAVLSLLGEAEADRYGHQRMFGSLGWGLAMFFVGIALDHATSFPEHPCGGPGDRERNYTICFATFSVLMGCALMTATQLNFKYDAYPPPPIATDPQPPAEDESQSAFLAERGDEGVGLQMHMGPLPPNLQGKQAQQQQSTSEGSKGLPFIGKTKMFAQVAGMGAAREVPEWVTVLKQFGNLKCASFLFVSWFMGFGIGLIFTFLFWHLQDYGGSPTLFGVASVINHISEIFAYFFSFRLITQIGHVKVLCLGLVGNVLRFLYISWLKNPWWVLPFEFMQGITHAAVWAACCSYLAHNTPHHLRGSAQGVLQGIHHGLGRGCGALIGGVFVYYFGTASTFRGYGFCCLFVLAAFVFINFYRKETGFVSELPPTEDPRQVAEETSHLAPHGVPSNPIPRALSSTRLHEMAGGAPGGSSASDAGGYGATYSTSGGGNLDIPGGGGGGGSNPFRTDGYSHSAGNNIGLNNSTPKDTDEYIKRNFQAYNEAVSSKNIAVNKQHPSSDIQYYEQHQQPVDAPSSARGSYKW